MAKPLNRYQEVILRDVQNPKYAKHQRWTWWIFGSFGSLFLLIYLFVFQGKLGVYWKFVHVMYQASLRSHDAQFRQAVYLYQHLILFTAFLGVLALFALLAFLAYDMQARNEVIGRWFPLPLWIMQMRQIKVTLDTSAAK